MNHKLLLIQRTIALLIILILIVGIIIFYYLDNYPKVEVRYIDRVIVKKEVVTEYIKEESDIYWQDFTVTAYTQYDDGCNNITSIGLDLNDNWTNYFWFVAVDPSIISYGKTVFIKLDNKVKEDMNINTEIIEAPAVDCGYKIKGNKLDLYFNNLQDAEKWGIRELPVGVIR